MPQPLISAPPQQVVQLQSNVENRGGENASEVKVRMPYKVSANSVDRRNDENEQKKYTRICFYLCVIFIKLVIVVVVISLRRRSSSYYSSYEAHTISYTPMMPLVTPTPSDVNGFNLISYGSPQDENNALRNQILSNLLDFSDGKTEHLEAKKRPTFAVQGQACEIQLRLFLLDRQWNDGRVFWPLLGLLEIFGSVLWLATRRPQLWQRLLVSQDVLRLR